MNGIFKNYLYIFVITVISVTNTYTQIGVNSVKVNENRNASGKLDGIQKYFYPNGNIFAEYDFVSDKLWNVITLKDLDGNLLTHGNLKDGNGTLIIYDDNSRILKKQNYVTGMMNGMTYLYSNGELYDSIRYVNNIVVSPPIEGNASVDIESSVFKSTEIMPRFPGCEDMTGTDKEKHECSQKKLLEYVYTHLKYPKKARDNGIEGTCVAQFVIDKEGKVDDINILKDINGIFGSALTDVLEGMNTKEIR